MQKYQKKLKSGKTEYYLNGLKLERSNISIFTSKDQAWNLLTEIGWVSIRSLRNEIYKIDIAGRYIGTYGATDALYKKIINTPAGKTDEQLAVKNTVLIKSTSCVMSLESQ